MPVSSSIGFSSADINRSASPRPTWRGPTGEVNGEGRFGGAALSKEAAEEAFFRIITYFEARDTPRAASQLRSWNEAQKVHAEVRERLEELGVHHGLSVEPNLVDMEAAQLFPQHWLSVLNEDLLADLIVDSFLSSFTDALVDGAITLVEVTWAAEVAAADVARRQSNDLAAQSDSGSNWRTPVIPRHISKVDFNAGVSGNMLGPRSQAYASAPTLPRPTEPPPVPLPMPQRFIRNSSRKTLAGLAVPSIGADGTSGFGVRSSTGSAPSQDGFVMRGLPKDSHHAWIAATPRISCPRGVMPLIHQINENVTLQRPHRRIVHREVEDRKDHRKFVWPISSTHFPEQWDEETKGKRDALPRLSSGQVSVVREAPSLKVNSAGRTIFDYSLVLHKAFLESQPNELLKDKARKYAPLRLSTEVTNIEEVRANLFRQRALRFTGPGTAELHQTSWSSGGGAGDGALQSPE